MQMSRCHGAMAASLGGASGFFVQSRQPKAPCQLGKHLVRANIKPRQCDQRVKPHIRHLINQLMTGFGIGVICGIFKLCASFMSLSFMTFSFMTFSFKGIRKVFAR